MIDDRTLANLFAYSAQVACIVALGTVLHYLLRIDRPRLRHAYWRCLLAFCLLLPLLQVWPSLPPAPTVVAPGDSVPSVTLTVSMRTGRVQSNEPVPWGDIVVRIAAVGMALRLLWTAIGLWQLRRLRTRGEAAEPIEHADLKGIVGVVAEIRYLRDIDQPVTFGARRPVIVLPAALRDHPEAVQRAVVCHELFHVRRHDWVWLLAEECVRAVFWFNPAVWWVISRIQLTREEAVDAAVVAATGERRVYLEALMTFADAAPLTPAAAFSRRRHLFTRIMLISKEAVMSSKRIVASCAAAAVVIAVGSWYAVDAFPLQGARPGDGVAAAPRPGQVVTTAQMADGIGPLERAAKPITPENPIPRRTHSVAVLRPAGAAPFVGAVTVRVTLDASGRVAEVRAGNGLPAAAAPYIQAAVDSVRQWQYDPPADAPISFSVSVVVPQSGDLIAMQAASDARELILALERGRAGGRGTLSGSGGGIGAARPGVTPGRRQEFAELVGQTGAAGRGVAVTTPVMPEPGAAIRVGGAIGQPRKTRHVNPEYPAVAQTARVQGVVILEAVIGADGRVQDARILRSIPLLDQAARDAVMQWEFEPTLLNGSPVPVIMTVTVQFTMPQEPTAQ